MLLHFPQIRIIVNPFRCEDVESWQIFHDNLQERGLVSFVCSLVSEPLGKTENGFRKHTAADMCDLAKRLTNDGR